MEMYKAKFLKVLPYLSSWARTCSRLPNEQIVTAFLLVHFGCALGDFFVKQKE